MMSQLSLDKLDWLARAWLTWMSSMSIHVAVLVLILWIIERCTRKLSGRLRFALWLLVLARLVVPPDLASPTGLMWWTGQWWPQITPDMALNATAQSSSNSLGDGAVTSVSGSAVANPLSLGAWPVSLFMIWLGAVVCQLGLMIYGWLLVESWLSQAQDVTDGRICQLLESARRRVGLRRPVRLRDSGHCTTPLVVGWLRPVILLPTAVLRSLKPAELEAVLVHELTHLSRGDCWWRVLQTTLRTIYFFHPAVWLANRALARTCEEACDELTVGALAGQRRDYAEAIFKAATLVGYQGPHLALNMLGDVMPVKARLSRILDPGLPQSAGGSWKHAILVMALALVLLPTGERRTQGIPPAAAKLSDLRLAVDADENNAAAPQLAPQTADAISDQERAALAQLKSEHFEQRLEAYETLSRIGTIHALSDLESAFLKRSGIEQDAAERALKHVWEIIRVQPAESNTSSRIYSEAPRENSYVFP